MYRVPAAVCTISLSVWAAQASSIVTLPDADGAAPSIIALGSAEPPTLEGVPVQPEVAEIDDASPPRYQIGGSILAFGLDAIPSTPVAVASIDAADNEPEKPSYSPIPFVIRGGVLGSAFSAPPADEIELPETTADDEAADPDQPLEQPG